MPRHPAPEYVDAQIVSTDGDMGGTDEARLFADFASDAKAADKTPTFVVWGLLTDPRTQKPKSSAQGSFLFEATMDAFATFSEICSHIRDNYGGGYFRITGRMIINGIEKVGFNKIVHIIEPRQREAPAAQNTAPSSDLVEVLRVMRISNAEANARYERLLETMQNRQEAPRSPAIDPNQIIQWATAAATLLTSLRGVFSPPTQSNNLLETIALVKGIKNFTDDLSGDARPADDGNVMTEMIRTFGKPLAMMLMAKQTQQSVPASVPIATPAPLLYPPNPVVPPNAVNAPRPAHNPMIEVPAGIPAGIEEAAMISPQLIVLKQYVNQLLTFAKASIPADTTAKTVLDSLTDQQLEQLMPVLEDAQCVERLVQLMPDAIPHREWLTHFRGALLELVEPIDESQDEDDHAPHSPDFGAPDVPADQS